MVTIFTAHDVADRCYLVEALEWVAFHRFPLAAITENNVDRREDREHIEGMSVLLPYDNTVTALECEEAGLPINPAWEDLESGDHHSAPDDIRRFLTFDLPEPELAKLRTDLAESIVFHDRQAAWDEEFAAFIDVHTAKLFLALREGRLVGFGKKLPKPTNEEAHEHFKATDWEGFNDLDWVPIPANFWALDKIEWNECCADGRTSAYCLILIGVDELLRVFPIPAGQSIANVVRLGDALVISNEQNLQQGQKPRGRPSLNWDDFHVEIARRLQTGTLPDKQEALIADMQAWSAKKWGKPAARSTLLQKIKPYYDTLIRKSQNRKS